MLKLPITFEGFEGERTEDFWFNLNKVEATKFFESDLAKQIKKLGDQGEVDNIEGIRVMEEFVLLCYGKRDGEQFIKNPKVREEFRSTVPFGEIVGKLLSDNEYLKAFFVGVMPKEARGEIAKVMDTTIANAEKEAAVPEEPTEPILEPATPDVEPDEEQPEAPPEIEGVNHETKTINRQAAISMDNDQLTSLVAVGDYTITD